MNEQHEHDATPGQAPESPDTDAALRDGLRAAPSDVALRMYAAERAIAATRAYRQGMGL